MKHWMPFVFALSFLLPALHAQESAVDSEELNKGAGAVEFISNTAAPAVFNTRAQIWGIGSRLGQAVRTNTGEAGGRAGYFVRHNLYPSEPGKLDGDIFGLGPGAGVDTIRNLRWIVQGYLEAAYSYNAADAAMLAEFITVYNAVYRKNRPYFAARYKTPLLNDLQPEGAEGLSTLWNEWPGQTLMLIPLRTAADGSLSAVDTSSITEGAVIDEMRKADDRGIEQRQAMVDLKEREADEAAGAAQLQREAIRAEEERIAAEQKRLAEERAALAQQKADGTLSPEEALSPEDAQKKEDELAAQEADLAAREEALESAREEAQANEDLAARKSEEAQAERSAISKDQAETLGLASPAQAAQAGILGIRLNPGSAGTGRVVRINPVNGAQMQSSDVTTLFARTALFAGGKIIAVATSGGKNALVEIDSATLKIARQGADEIAKDSLIWANGANLYAISASGGKNYLSRFDMALTKQASSAAEVHPLATVIFQGDKVLTQGVNGAVIILKAAELTE